MNTKQGFRDILSNLRYKLSRFETSSRYAWEKTRASHQIIVRTVESAQEDLNTLSTLIENYQDGGDDSEIIKLIDIIEKGHLVYLNLPD